MTFTHPQPRPYLDPAICHRALSSRDSRFDGKFYVGVKTTGVYCRPICPAPTALAKNCSFYSTAALAEASGFRPCLRCFPECSPNFVPRDIASDIVVSAIKCIQRGELENSNVASLALRFGVSARHLRRLFEQHLGVSPMQLINTQRVQRAKKLIGETTLTMSQIAFIAGFPNVRQFNADVKKTYSKTPSELRHKKLHFDDSMITVRLFYRPPYDWSQTLAYLTRRLISGVEAIEQGAYLRALKLDGDYGYLEVSKPDAKDYLQLKVSPIFWAHLQRIITKVRELFDLDADTQSIDGHLGRNDRLGKVITRQGGIRVLGCWDFLELSLRTIIGQQVTVAGAATLNARLVAKLGEPLVFEHLPSLNYLYPSAEHILNDDLSELGFTASRISTIKGFCEVYLKGDLQFDDSMDLAQVLAAMTAIKGIGDWTANYIAMRALRYTDAFPAGDLGLQKACGERPGEKISAKQLLQLSEQWRPWRAYGAMYLWQSLSF